MTSCAFSLGSAVYVRYNDHVLFKNISHPIADAVERETVGWLSRQTDDIMLIEHDRTLPTLKCQAVKAAESSSSKAVS
jgi:hypothetical protein